MSDKKIPLNKVIKKFNYKLVGFCFVLFVCLFVFVPRNVCSSVVKYSPGTQGLKTQRSRVTHPIPVIPAKAGRSLPQVWATLENIVSKQTTLSSQKQP